MIVVFVSLVLLIAVCVVGIFAVAKAIKCIKGGDQ